MQNNHVFRASMVGNLMASEKDNKLPVGAITALNEIVSQIRLGWQPDLNVLMIQKGRECEDESIELFNEYSGSFYMKNVERITKGLLTGECDIIDREKDVIYDIKTAFSKKTFPCILTMSKLYEWQLRAYMHLYDVNKAELVYCLVDTPEHLRPSREPENWHIVGNIPIKHRISTVSIDRDLEKENLLLKRLDLCSQYLQNHL